MHGVVVRIETIRFDILRAIVSSSRTGEIRFEASIDASSKSSERRGRAEWEMGSRLNGNDVQSWTRVLCAECTRVVLIGVYGKCS